MTQGAGQGTAGPGEPDETPAAGAAEQGAPAAAAPRVDARGALGVQVGDHSVQINLTTVRGATFTDGTGLPPLVSGTGTIDSPYRGLGAYGEHDARLFYGRESEIAGVLSRLAAAAAGGGILVVSGVSGAGKSSLLNAGVLPRLAARGLPGLPSAASWQRVVLAPSGRPLEELALRVAAVTRADAAATSQALAASPADFALTARQAALAGGGRAAAGGGDGQRRVLIVADQAEKLFTLCEREDQRQAFITALHAAASAAAALVVLAVRADFEARLAGYPVLVPAVQDRYLLTAMTARQLRLAVTRPAAAAGGSVDGDLVDLLLREARADGPAPAAIGAGVLPLLSHALDQAWRGRAGPALTLEDYERAGGIDGAVAASAQRAYGQLTAARQEIARQVFTRLTAVTDDGLETTARAATSELVPPGTGPQARDTTAVLEAFAAERLLILAAGTVEISHEIVLAAWPLLRDSWLADSRADRVIRSRLQATAAEWARAGHDPAYLYGGTRLEAAGQAAARVAADPRQAPLGPAVESFLHASRRAAQRGRRLRRGLVALLLALATGLGAFAVAARQASSAASRNGRQAASQRDDALSAELAGESQSGTGATAATLDAIAAWGLHPSAQSRYALIRAAASPQQAELSLGGAVTGAAVRPDGRLLATSAAASGSAPVVQLWNVPGLRRARALTLGGLSPESAPTLALSASGSLIAAGDDDGRVALWSTATGRRAGGFAVPGHLGIWALAVSPDSRLLAVGTGDGTTELWDIASRRLIGTGGPGSPPPSPGPMELAFSPDGRLLASGSENGTVRLWRVPAGPGGGTVAALAPAGAIPGPVGPVIALAFSPDSRLLAVSAGDVRLWDVRAGRQAGPVLRGPGPPVAPSPSRPVTLPSRLVIPPPPALPGLPSPPVPEPTITLTLPPGIPASGGLVGPDAAHPVDSVAFSPDGTLLAAGTDDGAVGLFAVASGRRVALQQAGSGEILAAAFSADGTTLTTASQQGAAQVWDVPVLAGRPAASLPTDAGPVQSLAYAPDGRTLAAGNSADGVIAMLDPRTGQPRVGGGVVAATPGSADGTWALAVSPDGRTLAAGFADGTVQLWRDGQPAGRPVEAGTADTFPGDSVATGLVSALAFSPDGRLLAAGDRSDKVRLFGAAAGRPVGRALPATASDGLGVVAVAFGQDGTTLATADGDGTVRLRNLASRRAAPRQVALPGDSSQIDAAAFSADGSVLAIGYADGTVRLWDVPAGQQVGPLLDTGSEQVSALAFAPGTATLAAAPGDTGTVQLWDLGYLADPLAAACARIGGTLTRAQWAAVVPHGPAYRPVCPRAGR